MTRKELLKSRIKVGSKVIVKLPHQNEWMATVTEINEQFWCYVGVGGNGMIALFAIEEALQTGMIHPADLKYRVGHSVAYSIIKNVIECTGTIWTIDVNPKNKPYRFISGGILYSANEKYLIKHDGK